MGSEVRELVSRLRAVESDPIGCGLANNSYRNPDGPEAATTLESLLKREAELLDDLRLNNEENAALLKRVEELEGAICRCSDEARNNRVAARMGATFSEQGGK